MSGIRVRTCKREKAGCIHLSCFSLSFTHMHTMHACVHMCTHIHIHLHSTPQGVRFTGSDRELQFWIPKKQGAAIFMDSCAAQDSQRLAPNTAVELLPYALFYSQDFIIENKVAFPKINKRMKRHL